MKTLTINENTYAQLMNLLTINEVIEKPIIVEDIDAGEEINVSELIEEINRGLK